MSNYQANDERERLAAEEAAWRERMERFAPPESMDRLVDLAMDCKHDLDKMEDNDDE